MSGVEETKKIDLRDLVSNESLGEIRVERNSISFMFKFGEQKRSNPIVPSHFRSLADIERDHIESVLSSSRTIEEAAEILGINMSTLWRKRQIMFPSTIQRRRGRLCKR
jgi:transcriptional regulator with PAS, ATPase and Fis domain